MKATKTYQVPVVFEVSFYPHLGNPDVPEQALVCDFVLQTLNQQIAKVILVGDVSLTAVSVATKQRGKPTSLGTLMVTAASSGT